MRKLQWYFFILILFICKIIWIISYRTMSIKMLTQSPFSNYKKITTLMKSWIHSFDSCASKNGIRKVRAFPNPKGRPSSELALQLPIIKFEHFPPEEKPPKIGQECEIFIRRNEVIYILRRGGARSSNFSRRNRPVRYKCVKWPI